MSRLLPILLPALIAATAAGCNQPAEAPAPADAVIASSAGATRASAGDAVFQAAAMDVTRLDPAIASRYGLHPHQGGALLLVTLRDAEGNGLPPDDLVLTATANVPPDPPKALALQHVQIDGLNDYIGVFAVRPPASVQFQIHASRHGQRADLDTQIQLYPPSSP